MRELEPGFVSPTSLCCYGAAIRPGPEQQDIKGYKIIRKNYTTTTLSPHFLAPGRLCVGVVLHSHGLHGCVCVCVRSG